MDLLHHLENSIWTLGLEHTLETFSLSTYLNWFDYDWNPDYHGRWYDNLPESFLYYLVCKVSEHCIQTKFQLQLLILIRENLNLVHHHLLHYMKHVNSFINNPPARETFRLMSTVWFILQK